MIGATAALGLDLDEAEFGARGDLPRQRLTVTHNTGIDDSDRWGSQAKGGLVSLASFPISTSELNIKAGTAMSRMRKRTESSISLVDLVDRYRRMAAEARAEASTVTGKAMEDAFSRAQL
jgi:hypothetical protein